MPDGEVASLGRKVKIHYTVALKEGGHAYDSSFASAPFKFRLGKGKAIQGLQLGLEVAAVVIYDITSMSWDKTLKVWRMSDLCTLGTH